MTFVRSLIRGATRRAFRAQIWNYIDDRNHLHAMVTNNLRFGPKPELNETWVARGDIDIEEILRVFFKFVGPVDMRIAKANASTEIAQIPLIIENIMENSFLVTLNTWTTKPRADEPHGVDHNAFKQSSMDCVLRATSRVALAIFTTKQRLCRKPSDQKPQRK
jgi:hypothetical protein